MRDPRTPPAERTEASGVYVIRERRAATEFARALSTIFNPFLSATGLFIIVSHAFAHHSTFQFWVYSTIGVICYTVAPLTFILYLYLTGRISDFDISERPERERVFAGFVVIYLAAAIGLSLAHAPVQLQVITWGSWGTALETMVITRWWKISTHALGIAGPFAAMFILFQAQPLPYLAIVPLVGWARIHLRSHTFAQVIGGVLLAVANTAIFFRLFHLI